MVVVVYLPAVCPVTESSGHGMVVCLLVRGLGIQISVWQSKGSPDIQLEPLVQMTPSGNSNYCVQP